MEQLDGPALAIVEACLGVPAGPERDRLIAEHSGGNEALRDRVRELLAEESGDFGALATEMFVAKAGAARPLPDRVGPFRITGLIAEGGMGSVAKAERDDGVYAQTVAIKFIRGDLSAEAARQRFDAERRILARLNHPAIAHVVDGGSQDGWPWLAMEYVDGAPLAEALASAGASAEARLDAFLAVCEAVAFAHRNLVIHADIKPANVLMRADGAIKLLDFGIARLLVEIEPDEAASAHPLTPGYAAPERAGGAAPTIAADIYSLGVLLREILGGAERDADLAAIIGRAAAADPETRYADVPALAADITAYRTHRPIAARADAGWRYFARKFLRRHRLGVGVAGAIVAILTGAAIVATLLYVRAERARAESERRFEEVRALSRLMLFDLYDDLADSPGTLPSRLRLAQTARTYLERLQQVPNAPADVQLDIARGWRRLAAVEGLSGVSSLGHQDQARAALDRAEAQAAAILAARPGDAGALDEMGWIALGRWTILTDTAGSAALTRRAAGFFRRALAVDPSSATARLGLLTARRNHGYDLIWADQPARAVPVLRAALNELRARRFPAASQREARLLEVSILSRLGDAVYYAGDPRGSLAWYREQDALAQAELARRASIVWADKLGEAKFNIAGTLADLPGGGGEALAELRAGSAMLERALAFGADRNLERRLYILYGQEALVLNQLGRAGEAAAVSDRGIAIRRSHLARAPGDAQNHRAIAVAMVNHARILAAAGRRGDACTSARQGLSEWTYLRSHGELGTRDASVEIPETEAAVRLHCR